MNEKHKTLLIGSGGAAAIAVGAFVLGSAFADRGGSLHKEDRGSAQQAQDTLTAAPLEDLHPSARSKEAASGVGGRSLVVDGQRYRLQENDNGAVLSSLNGMRIFIGKDCDLQSQTYGMGHWDWSNGGFSFRFASREFNFPRMDPPLEIDECRS